MEMVRLARPEADVLAAEAEAAAIAAVTGRLVNNAMTVAYAMESSVDQIRCRIQSLLGSSAEPNESQVP